METTIPRMPWDMLPGEPEDEHALFLAFLEAQETAQDFADRARVSRGTVARASARWRWRARRALFREHLVREQFMAATEEARDLGRDIARHMAKAVDLAGEALSHALATGDLPSVRDSLAILAEARRQTELAAGRPTARIDLSAASDEALAEARKILDRLDGCATLAETEPEHV